MTVSEDKYFVEEQSNLKAINIKTASYPGFATPKQPTTLLLTAEGVVPLLIPFYENVNHVFEPERWTILRLQMTIFYTGGRSLRGANVKLLILELVLYLSLLV